jgi:RHS repeat-associated protein
MLTRKSVRQRHSETSPIETTNYLYDGGNVIEETENAGNVLARYTQEVSVDMPLSMLRSGTGSYYEQDGLGSVTSLSNSAGTLANTYNYDSFGKLNVSTGTLTNPYQYTAREFDPETGIYEYRARYYDQNAGRYSSEDPIRFKGGKNWYAYVGNEPTTLVDPFGYDGGPWHPHAGISTKCSPGDLCPVIRAKMWILKRMIDSHTGWDLAMPSPRGGGRHATEIAQLWKQYADCQALLGTCKDLPCIQAPPPPTPAVTFTIGGIIITGLMILFSPAGI